MADLEYNDDRFHAEMQTLIDAKVQEIQANANTKPSTYCLFCQDPLPKNHGSFCDADCRDFHQREQHNLKVRGLV